MSKMKKNKESNLFFVMVIIIIILLALIFAFLVITIPYSNTEKSFICKELMNESYSNGTQTGYRLGVIDVSNFVLQTGQLPVFVNESIGFQYLNLKEMFNGNNR